MKIASCFALLLGLAMLSQAAPRKASTAPVVRARTQRAQAAATPSAATPANAGPASLRAQAAAPSATWNVTTLADSGTGSLRAQVAAAASGDRIAIAVTGTISLSTGEILITGKNLTISGPGADRLTVSTNAVSRALRIVNAQCTISGITFDNCRAFPGDADTGGALAVDNFTAGGGAFITTIDACGFTNNQSGWGGAVDIFRGGLNLRGCTFSGNSCTGLALGTLGGGGALSLGPSVASFVTNCTFSANTQSGAAAGQPGGGAIYNYGAGLAAPPTLTVEHCTFAGNIDAAGAAGAIRGNHTGSYRTWASLHNCLLLNNQAPATALKNFAGNPTGSLAATYGSLGGNVTDEGATSTQFMAANLDHPSLSTLAASIAPTLAPNGGTTPTHALLRGSPGQRRGTASTSSTDQRGAPRHANPDAGAYELIEPELAMSVSGTSVAEGGAVDLGAGRFDAATAKTLTFTNTQTSPFAAGPLVLDGFSLPAGFSSPGSAPISLAGGQSVQFRVSLISQPGLYGAPLTFTGNDAFNPALALPAAGAPNFHSIQLSGLVTDTADHWRQQNFGPGATNSGVAADNANPAGDGLPNLLKYSLGLDPRKAYPPTAGPLASLDAAGCLWMTVARNPAATDVTLAIQVTGDLTQPAAWNTTETTLVKDDATVLQAHDNVSSALGKNRFIRLQVSRP